MWYNLIIKIYHRLQVRQGQPEQKIGIVKE